MKVVISRLGHCHDGMSHGYPVHNERRGAAEEGAMLFIRGLPGEEGTTFQNRSTLRASRECLSNRFLVDTRNVACLEAW